jgi:peptidoglycan/LPS O-acetylase OafA/YrhL
MQAMRRLRSLDLLRGIAAIIVLFWHFSGIFHAQPAFEIFRPFYTNGQAAVDVFFVISGFILQHVYADKFGSGADLQNFIVRRLARLYPLHLITLLIVAALFFGFYYKTGIYGYVFLNDDLRHFLMNLFFVQYVGFQDGFSFNAPSWSLSSEFWINIIFGALILTLGRKLAVLAGLIIAVISAIVLIFIHGQWLSLTSIDGWLEPILLRAAAGFFAGVVTYEIWTRTQVTQTIANLMLTISACSILVLMSLPRTSSALVFVEASIAIIAAPLMIFSAASSVFAEKIGSSYPGRWIGVTSFSVYMWHFPVAAAMALAGLEVLPPSVILCLFIGLTFLMASISVVYMEFPLRDMIVRSWNRNHLIVAR